MKANHHTRLPLRMVWVDTEAVNQKGEIGPGRQRLTFGVALYDQYRDTHAAEPEHEDSLRFTHQSEFWAWVESKCLKGRTLWVLAHNWNYDAGILDTSNTLLGRGWTLKKYINGKPPVIVRWEKDGAYLHMIDTMNYFMTSVESLGVAVDLPKLKMPSKNASVKVWDKYAWRDCEIIRLAFLGFRTFVLDEDLGTMQPTLASQALTAYRHRFMPHKILIHDNQHALKLEREGYHGGRTETFWNGHYDGELWKLDINSMYPTVMRKERLSARFCAYFPSYKPASWRTASDGYGRIARCVLKTNSPAYGLVHDSRLIFPIGTFQTVLTDPEIHYAEAHNHLVSVGEWAVYEQDNLFEAYVDHFYGLRGKYKEAGNVTFDLMTKLLLNALYGKFGQSGKRWTETNEYSILVGTEMAFQETPESPIIQLRHRLGRTQRLDKSSESENSAPIIAAEITAHARLMLWELIKKAGRKNVIYVDTDSLIVNKAGRDRLNSILHATNLGYIKIEGTTTGAEFWAAKDYLFDGKATIKGIRKKARKITEVDYEQERFCSWDYNLKRGVDGFIDVEIQRKHLSRINLKGVVDGTGIVKPHRFKWTHESGNYCQTERAG